MSLARGQGKNIGPGPPVVRGDFCKSHAGTSSAAIGGTHRVFECFHAQARIVLGKAGHRSTPIIAGRQQKPYMKGYSVYNG